MKHSPFGGCFVFITEIDFEFAVFLVPQEAF